MKKLLPAPAGGNATNSFAQIAISSAKIGLKPFGLKSVVTILIIFLLSTHFVIAQKIDTSASPSPRVMYDYYMGRHNTDKTIGWLLLVPGATMMTVRSVMNVKNGSNIFSNGFNPVKGDRLGLIGGVMAFTSIHFFISAGSDKRKASLSLKRETVPFGDKGPGKYQFTALVLKIKL